MSPGRRRPDVSSPEPHVTEAVAFDESPPLRELAGRADRRAQVKPRLVPERGTFARDTGFTGDGAVQSKQGADPVIFPLQSFEGLRSQDNSNVFGGRVNPPAPVGDVSRRQSGCPAAERGRPHRSRTLGDVQAAGVVLAGGRSSRMGTAKAALPWHGSTLLRRSVGVVARGADGPVVVVRAPGQSLPELPDDVRVCDDPQEGFGPLQGLAVGLHALADSAEVAFCCSTDLPFLHTAFVARVVEAMDDEHDVVLPMARGFRQPLAAAYRPALAGEIDAMLAAGLRKPAHLFDRCRVLRLDDDDLLADHRLAAADPALDSVAGVNDPADYDQAHARPVPEVSIERYGVLARNGHRGARTVRATTIAEAARACGLAFDRHVVAAVNGDRVTRDGATPLVAGDAVTFVSADAGG